MGPASPSISASHDYLSFYKILNLTKEIARA